MRIANRDSLTPEEQELLQAAMDISRTATATYSKYHVGAALKIQTPDGQELIVTGNNYETQNYNSVCAEKHALIKAFANYAVQHEDGTLERPKVIAVAVYCASGGEPQQPCGDCRQALTEVNPDMRVIAAAGPRKGEPSEWHDNQVTLTTLRELLPYYFEIVPELSPGHDGPAIVEPESVEDYVVHLPKPGDLSVDASARRALLEGVEYMLLVGSPKRARKVAQLAHTMFGSTTDADSGCYCDLTIPGRDESGREFALYVVNIPDGPRIAVVSHGIGEAGVEIVLSEVPALLALATGKAPTMRGVIRSGTRGTLSQAPLGCVALSTSTANDALDWLQPTAALQDRIRSAARTRGMTVVAEQAIDGYDWSSAPAGQFLVEGPALSTRFFWQGQARPLYVPGRGFGVLEQRNRLKSMLRWTRAGVRWIEMEDYAVHRICALCGYPSASVGAVIAHRRNPEGDFQLDYDKAAYVASEMLPVEIALEALIQDARG